jgi:hypothetical protein
MTHSSVAILVDGDNVPSTYAGQILRKAADLGPQRARLTFCNAPSLMDWSAAPSFRPVHSGTGKNGSDILLSIRAIEMAFRDGIEAFVIVSSDSDMSHVANRLRELGHYVLGLGEDKAPHTFRLACTRFQILTPPLAKVDKSQLDTIDRIVRKILDEHDPDGKGLLLNRLNGLVRSAGTPPVKISEQPEKNWPAYLARRPNHYTLSGQGPSRTVRIATEDDLT